jgi:S1-C subfamily serine protease
VLTNAHVLPESLDTARRERLTVFVGQGSEVKTIGANTVALDRDHDLAVLKLERRIGPGLRLGDSRNVEEGRSIAFTGFPIGAVLGLYPVTHTGIVSAITPIVIPAPSVRQLNPKLIRRMRAPYTVFQLDATAYPGNSGSPVFDPGTGRVIGVVNRVFVKGTKEALLEKPSGITYAIPIQYAKALLKKKGISIGSQ